jgi:putative Mg2+ transporter-C (MgtC) family protein
MENQEIFFRLCLATVAGVLLGLNRDLHGKPTGVRTLGLVGLTSALLVISVAPIGEGAASRVIQGIVTRIGFLGAGVILRDTTGTHIHGITTAACVWLTACIGAACAVGNLHVILLSLPIVFLILILGGPFEKFVHRHWPSSDLETRD